MPNPPSAEGKLKDLMVFNNVARALTSTLELDEVLRAILEQMEPFFQPKSWALLMLDEAANELYYVIAAGQKSEELKNLRIPVGEGMAGWVAERGETLIVPEVEEDPRFSNDGDGAFRIHSAISLPLRSRRRTLGVIQLFNCDLSSLTDYTIMFLHVLCDYAAIAIENARAVKRIHELTITDDCTGLFNVRHLQKVLENEIERSLRFKKSFTLIFIDLDRFKSVNDKHGHLIGSRLLGEVGRWLCSSGRSIDICFRYGGDEFIILMPETPKQEGVMACIGLRDSLRSHVFDMGNGLNLKVSASFGIAAYPDDGITPQRVISAADDAMYNVKADGRDGVAVAGSVLPTGIASQSIDGLEI
jgi:diguanylate cyclase (GGDEF)-like protein